MRTVRTLGDSADPVGHLIDGFDVAPRAARREGVGAAGEDPVTRGPQDANVVVAVLLRLALVLTQAGHVLRSRPRSLF